MRVFYLTRVDLAWVVVLFEGCTRPTFLWLFYESPFVARFVSSLELSSRGGISLLGMFGFSILIMLNVVILFIVDDDFDNFSPGGFMCLVEFIGIESLDTCLVSNLCDIWASLTLFEGSVSGLIFVTYWFFKAIFVSSTSWWGWEKMPFISLPFDPLPTTPIEVDFLLSGENGVLYLQLEFFSFRVVDNFDLSFSTTDPIWVVLEVEFIEVLP